MSKFLDSFDKVIKVSNLLMIISFVVIGTYLISERFSARDKYAYVAKLQNDQDKLNREYTKLLLEYGTYSSELAIQGYASSKAGMVAPTKDQIIEMK